MNCGGIFDADTLSQKREELEELTHEPAFWNDQTNAKKVNKDISLLTAEIEKDKKLQTLSEDLQTYQLLLEEEFNDQLFLEAMEKAKEYSLEIERLENLFLLDGKFDNCNAILTIHPGAGGTESQDWAEMLLRMYKRWAEKSKYEFKIVDILAGEEAGIKSATIEIIGDKAYGFLKGESGIHRLVRMSPFNAQGKRQTSFTSIFVYPFVEEEIEIDVNPADLRIDTYRASGAGGQHVNTTDSAVRITHIPTGIVAQCQNERSQTQNRETAMKMLKSRLYQLAEEQKEAEKAERESSKTEIGWGNQIRSYVFQPYQMVKDHRTNFEIGNTSIVMDGELDGFINAFLKLKAMEKQEKK